MNSKKLKGKIIESGMTQGDLARELGMSLKTLNSKINNRSKLTVEEVKRIINILSINNPSEIFFGWFVQEMQRYKNLVLY